MKKIKKDRLQKAHGNRLIKKPDTPNMPPVPFYFTTTYGPVKANYKVLKTLKNWEQKPLCNTILNLEIIRCGVYMKVGETFRRNMPSEIIENTDSTNFILHDPAEYDVTGMAESCYERLVNEYGKYDCFKNNFKDLISKKIKELSEQQ